MELNTIVRICKDKLVAPAANDFGCRFAVHDKFEPCTVNVGGPGGSQRSDSAVAVLCARLTPRYLSTRETRGSPCSSAAPPASPVPPRGWWSGVLEGIRCNPRPGAVRLLRWIRWRSPGRTSRQPTPPGQVPHRGPARQNQTVKINCMRVRRLAVSTLTIVSCVAVARADKRAGTRLSLPQLAAQPGTTVEVAVLLNNRRRPGSRAAIHPGVATWKPHAVPRATRRPRSRTQRRRQSASGRQHPRRRPEPHGRHRTR